MFDPEAELDELISHFSRQLAPADRGAFRRAAENMLASAPESWGPGSIYRALVPLWRGFFHPPTVERTPRPGSPRAPPLRTPPPTVRPSKHNGHTNGHAHDRRAFYRLPPDANLASVEILD